jgi:hypothetical protein
MRLFLNRCLLLISVFMICTIIALVHITQPSKIGPIIPPNEIQLLLDQLFDSSSTLDDVQLCWNRLIKIWKKTLFKFLHDACHLCHRNDRHCSKSVDINLYIDYINKTFYPIDETKLPHGMGLYYDFDLKLMRSLNNSSCDYFHMFQLMMYVQIVLHEREIKYFMTKGTFIGSLRHHDVIPWDTDIDIFIPYSSVFTFIDCFRQHTVVRDKNNIDTIDEDNETDE